jgi:GH15 family glucan-1,4-alpha-glucosidase
MALPIEDYALIGDNHTAALVGKDGSIDWLCLPRFDSAACFAALLGDRENGYWSLAPVEKPVRIERRYREGTLVLETTFHTATGSVTIVDAMLAGLENPRISRIARCTRGQVAMRMEYAVRFDYGSIVPWLRRVDEGLLAVAGPDALLLSADIELRPDGMHHVAEFTAKQGQDVAFELTYFSSHLPTPAGRSPQSALAETEGAWRTWIGECRYDGPYREQVDRSLLTLRALTYTPTGGIVAAPTTSLPELSGGERNWDYRYCWLRDATFTLYALLSAGYVDSARDWRAWLLRAVAGVTADAQIVYGLRGTRRLTEFELPWLSGYEGSRPVRIGNAAHGQFQLDVFGEVVDLLYASHRFGIEHTETEWAIARTLVDEVVKRWRQTDSGIWEIRGEPQHFTHSKVMAWVALDRGVRFVEEFGLEGSLDEWCAVRDEIHADVCEKAFDSGRNAFVQAYGSHQLDAATLLLPIVGFLPHDDPRIAGTVAAIERELVRDGLVMRYSTTTGNCVDGLPPGEGAFLACTFWLVDNYALAGRTSDARELFERVCELSNDVGLMAEEYDPVARRQLGNFPQAFSHVGLINSAFNLDPTLPKARHEKGRATPSAR